VETSLSVARTIHIPEGTEPGTYTIEALAFYEDKTAFSIASFRVVRPLSAEDYVKSGIVAALAIAVVIAYERLCAGRRTKTKHHVRSKKVKARVRYHFHKKAGKHHKVVKNNRKSRHHRVSR
jgi:hypothetical protein